MEPLPETRTAVDLFGVADDGADILAELERSAALVQLIVPSLVGVSLAAIHYGVTLTLVATSEEIATLDAVQYLRGGPCVTGAHEDRAITFETDDPVDEARWATFARATASAHVSTTLTLPITRGHRVLGTLNLYASTPRAFDTHPVRIAALFGAWAGGAVTNADLGFQTRRTAQDAPQVLQTQALVAQAAGVLASASNTSTETTRDLIAEAAVRAGVAEGEVARRIIAAFSPKP